MNEKYNNLVHTRYLLVVKSSHRQTLVALFSIRLGYLSELFSLSSKCSFCAGASLLLGPVRKGLRT